MFFKYSNTLRLECFGTILLIVSLCGNNVDVNSSQYNGYGIINAIISLVITAVNLFLNRETIYVRLVKTYWIHILSLIYHLYNVLVLIYIINNIIYILPKNSINDNIQESEKLDFMSNAVFYRWIFYNRVYFCALLANITIASTECMVLDLSGKYE